MHIYNKDSLKCDRWMVTNIFTSNSTRELFPSWDDPTINSLFKISIQHDQSFIAFSSVPTQQTLIENDNLRLTHFKEIRSVSTYSIVIAVVSGIVKYSEQSDIHYMWHEPEIRTRIRYAFGIAEDITVKLQENANIILSRYIQKIDHIILPDSPMKSAGKFGIIIYRYVTQFLGMLLPKLFIPKEMGFTCSLTFGKVSPIVTPLIVFV